MTSLRSTTVLVALTALLVAAATVAHATETSSFSFVSIGDWGCVPIGGWEEENEFIVARQFARTASNLHARFVLNTGDNFYYCGVHNKTDAMWNSTFENVFTEPSMMVPWYGCLGNHDYGYTDSAESQIAYTSPNSNRWVLPGAYYYRRLQFPGEVDISLVVLDASPCQSEYTSDDPVGWDPCGSVIPGCPGCTFHQNVVKQNCTAQLAWLHNLLPTIPANDWKIVMTHAPAQSLDNEDFVTPLREAGFHLWINGHVHQLSQYTMDNVGTYITSGAGCYVRLPNETGVSDTIPRFQPLKWTPTSCTGHNTAHTCQILFQNITPGYTSHTFNANFTEMTTTFYDYAGNQLHSTTTSKTHPYGRQ